MKYATLLYCVARRTGVRSCCHGFSRSLSRRKPSCFRRALVLHASRPIIPPCPVRRQQESHGTACLAASRMGRRQAIQRPRPVPALRIDVPRFTAGYYRRPLQGHNDEVPREAISCDPVTGDCFHPPHMTTGAAPKTPNTSQSSETARFSAAC